MRIFFAFRDHGTRPHSRPGSALREAGNPAAIAAIAGTIGALIRRSVQYARCTNVSPSNAAGAATEGHRQSPGRMSPPASVTQSGKVQAAAIHRSRPG